MAVLALIPARKNSKGIPGKNFRKIGGRSLVERAVQCALLVPCDRTVLSSDVAVPLSYGPCVSLPRPAELAQDDTPMLAVVQHALQQIPGAPDDIIVLLQPTQPMRKPEHIQQAIALLQETPQAESVVSVVRIPATHHPANVLAIREPGPVLENVIDDYMDVMSSTVLSFPSRRQDVEPAYIRDGTVYAFYRATVEKRGTIYGHYAAPLIIDPADTCELDTMEQWTALEARWSERHAQTPRS